MLKSLGSKPGFLRIRAIETILTLVGAVLDCSEELIISTMMERRISRKALVTAVSIRFWEQVETLALVIIIDQRSNHRGQV